MAEHHKEIKAVKFVNTAIIAPPKRDVLAFLGIPSEPGKPAEKAPKALLRRAETAVRLFSSLFRVSQWL